MRADPYRAQWRNALSVDVGRSNAAALASLLYAGSTFALPRKRAAALLAAEGERHVRRRAKRVEARNQRIVAAYRDGCSAYEIATLEAVSAHTVYYVLYQAGISIVHGSGTRLGSIIAERATPFDEHNTRIERNGARRCRTCARDRGRAWAQRRRAERDHS